MINTDALTGDNELHTVARKRTTVAPNLFFHENILNGANFEGESPLITAVKERCLPTIKCFVKLPSLDFNRGDFDGNTALHHAILQHDLTFLSPLCDFGANPTILNGDGQSCIHLAAMQTDPAVMRNLLIQSQKARENINLLNDEGETPLMVAVKANNIKIVSLLLRKSAHIHEVDLDGNMALHLAVLAGNLQIARILITVPGVQHKNAEGHTPIQLATRNGRGSLFDLLRLSASDFSVKDADDNTILHLACYPEDTAILKFLLQQQVFYEKREVRNTDGRTALHLACSIGKASAVRILVAANATMATTDFFQQTPLMTAIHYGYTAVAELLLSLISSINMSAQINHRDAFGNTPLHLCSISDNVRIATLLIEKGAKTFIPNNGGQTPVSIIEISREKTDSEVYNTLYRQCDPDIEEIYPAVAGPSWKP